MWQGLPLRTIEQQDYPLGALYLIPTPIGNLGDISLRALWLLTQCTTLACEDTRVTRQLLRHYGFNPQAYQCFSAHQHNENERIERVITALAAGIRVGLLSDAGTPAISDPGAKIVAAVQAQGFRVIPLAGASALSTGLSACGWHSAQAVFLGFAPTQKLTAHLRAQWQQFVVNVAPEGGQTTSLIWYEAPHRMMALLAAMQAQWPASTPLWIGRELTKQFEQCWHGTLAQAVQAVATEQIALRGEFVVMAQLSAAKETLNAHDATLQILLAELPVAQAVRLAVAITGGRKNQLYNRALELQQAAGQATTNPD